MAEAVAGVRFDISAETAKLQEGVKKAQAMLRSLRGSASSMQSSLSRVGGTVAAAFVADRLVTFVGHAVQAGAAINDLADQAGLSAEEFQELQFALRSAGVDGEKLSTAFATFGKHLSDLNRGTGSLLDFTKRFAPALGEQLKGITDTNEAVSILVRFISELTSKQDQLRVAQEAMGRQGSKVAVEMANLGTALDGARQAARNTGNVLSNEQVDALEKSQQAWADFGRQVTIATAGLAAAGAKILDTLPKVSNEAEILSQRLPTLGRDSVDASVRFGGLALSLQDITARLKELNGTMMLSVGGKLGAQILPGDQLKIAQANLQLLQSQLQAMPPAAFQMSAAFQKAFGQTAAVINLNASAEERGALIGAAANNMRVQAYQAYVSAMGAALPLQDQHLQRIALINLAVADETQRRLALNQANVDYAAAQMQLAAAIGATIDPLEQYRLKLEQIKAVVDANKELAPLMASAQRNAALSMAASYNSAASQVAGALAQAFPKNKAFAQAVAITSGLAGAIRVYSELPFWLAVPASATILAASIANAAKIGSTSLESPTAGGGGAVAAPAAAPAAPTQMVQVTLHGSRFSRDEVLGLMDQISVAVKDGAQLVVSR